MRQTIGSKVPRSVSVSVTMGHDISNINEESSLYNCTA